MVNDLEQQVHGILYTSFKKDLFVEQLKEVGVDVSISKPDPGEGVPNSTLAIGSNYYYGERAIAHYIVHRQERLHKQ